MRQQPELTVRTVPVDELVPYVRNAKKHPQKQVDEIAASISEFGNCDPIGVWTNADGQPEVVEGHGRLLALKQLGIKEAPVIFLDHLTDEQRRAYTHVHNQTTLSSDFDWDVLAADMAELECDWASFGFEDYDMRSEFDKAYDAMEHKPLAEDFVVAPFTVLDARSGEWVKRKEAWLKLCGDLSATRDVGAARCFDGDLTTAINGGTSNFDPVLAEVVYRWFAAPGWRVLDPFGGEQTKGVVAGVLGLDYVGIELRGEQVEVNRAATKSYGTVEYVCGDSTRLRELVRGEFDLCFTSPPYYNLEKYSDAKDDASAAQTYDDFMAMYRAVFEQCYGAMRDGSFLVLKVGDIRDERGNYRGFVADNVRMMREIGFNFYNDMVLVQMIGTAQIRARRAMRNRKITKVHQNVLVFYKGDTSKVAQRFDGVDWGGAGAIGFSE